MVSPSASGPERACQVLVEGRVQAVGFRWHAREEASRLGLAGWTRNLADGRVELHLEGEEPALRAMLDWLASGPSAAQVHAVQERQTPLQGLTGFEIKPDGIAPA